jgi:hypothetical protein
MAGTRQHADVGAGAEHVLLAGPQYDRLDFRVLEAHALDDIGEFNVDAEIIGIELEFIALEQTAGFIDVHEYRRDFAVICDAPVPITVGIGLKIDR